MFSEQFDLLLWHYFELNIKKMCHYNVICSLSDKKFERREEVVNFTVMKNSQRIYGSIIQDATSPVSSRYPFNDKEIIERSIIDTGEKKITYCNPANHFSTIDIIFSISKKYLEDAVDPSVKWLLRNIHFLRPIEKIEKEKIGVKETARKMSIVKLELYVGSELIGQLVGMSINET